MKPPSLQIVMDAGGMPLSEPLMHHLENCVRHLLGAVDRKMFWVTRTDIYHQFLADYWGTRLLPENLAEERFHQPSADLYIPDFNDGYPKDVPIGRIINLAVPPEVR